MGHDSYRKRCSDLSSFRDLQASLPATKMGAILMLLPEIQILQRQGHKTRAIWESLTNDGLQMTYELFRLYLSRARLKKPQFNGPILTPPAEGRRKQRALRGKPCWRSGKCRRPGPAPYQRTLRFAGRSVCRYSKVPDEEGKRTV